MKTTHTKQNKQSTGRLKSKSLLTSSIVAIFIAISPYIFYLYQGLPKESTWETSFFTFVSPYQENVYIFGWLLMQKVVPFFLLILWFFTCRDWWYHVILIPIAMYSFQILNVINDEAQTFDEVEIYYVIPIMMIIIPIVYFIRIKLFDKHVYGIDLEKIDAELAEYERKEKELLEENNK
ncbi:hypothetical protein EZY14_009980 [Kordia sp. TARA_039_SRF]|nr:hypothetical protein EZY14_009980 [Kordia sp. TARA_039_SRF]